MIYAPTGLERGIAALAGEPVFSAILERAGAPRFRRRANGFATLLHIILEQQVSIEEKMAEIKAKLIENRTVLFSSLFQGGWSRNVLIATFLAVLEIVRTRFAQVKQDKQYAEIVMEIV